MTWTSKPPGEKNPSAYRPDIDLTEEEIANWELEAKPKGPGPFKLLFALLFLAALFFLWGNEYLFVNRYNGFGPITILLALVTSISFFVYVLKRDGAPSVESVQTFDMRGSPFGFSFMLFLVLPLIASLGLYSGAARVLNVVLDTSVEKTRVVTIQRREVSLRRSDVMRRSWLQVDDEGTQKWVPVPWELYPRLMAYQNVHLTTRDGAFGGEYVIKVQIAKV